MFPAKAIEQLGYYVYRYVDPRTDETFYVGKGKGNRCFAHVKERGTTKKCRIIQDLKRAGFEPKIEILKYGLTEAEAFLVEATTIDLLDLEKLANIDRGRGWRHGAGGPVEDIASELAARPAKIGDPVVLININQHYRAGMELQDLYDTTRAAWKVAPHRHSAKYALSVYRGIVREVFEIADWLPAGSTLRACDADGRPRHPRGRFEFVGKVADARIRRKYFGRSVAGYVRPGAQNPVHYVNC